MIRKLSATQSRRPARRRTLPYNMRRRVLPVTDENVGEALLAHWTAMQQAMAATGAQRG